MGLQFEYADKLISLVFERRPIWDVKDVNYHNKEARKNCWNEICVELGADLTDIYRKWKNLKDTFVREYKKEQLFDRKKSTRWIYYERLMFLSERFKYECKSKHEQNEHDYLGIGTQSKRNDQENNSLQRPAKRLRSRSKNNNRSITAPATDNTNPEKDNPDYYFLLSLLPYMKEVKPERKLAVRMKLQQVFVEESSHQQQLCSSSTSDSTALFSDNPPDATEINAQSNISEFISNFTVVSDLSDVDAK